MGMFLLGFFGPTKDEEYLVLSFFVGSGIPSRYFLAYPFKLVFFVGQINNIKIYEKR